METVYENLPSEAQQLLLAKDHQIIQLQFQLDQYKRMIFGAKSERFAPAIDASQLSLEIEQHPVVVVEDETIIVDQHERKKKNKKQPLRQPFPASLPREIITIYPEGYDANSTETVIGKEITEVLEEIPGKIYVIRFERLKFAKAEGAGVAIGTLPSRIIEKGLFGEMLLTRILIDKYCDHLPIYRQLERFKRAGIKLAYSTLNDVPTQVGTRMVPLYDELVKQALCCTYLQADETPHPVLDSNVKGKTHRGFLWVYRSVEQRLVLFDYRPGRGNAAPKEMLKHFRGFLQSDGYSGYEQFKHRKDIILVGCMAHARRKFEVSLKSNREPAEYFMTCLQKVYAVEREIKEGNLSNEEILCLRKERALPVLNELESWMQQNRLRFTDKEPIRKAINYTLPRWKKLTEYVYHPLLEIDNNLVENAIRPTVLGRKNYLFSGSHEAAQRSAMFYSFIGSCKMNGINPEEWLADILVKLPDTKTSQLYTLLPNYWKGKAVQN